MLCEICHEREDVVFCVDKQTGKKVHLCAACADKRQMESESLNLPLLIRGFGVLLAIVCLLFGPLPRNVMGYVHYALLFTICVPFSRIRSGVIFWTLFSAYTVSVISFVVFNGWFAMHEFGTPVFLFNLITVAPVALVLVVQFPCILFTWSRRNTNPTRR
jgi:hypothetical protein